MFTYTNTSDQDLEIPNVGVVAAGETIDSEDELFSPLLAENKATKSEAKKADTPSTPSNDTTDKEPAS